MKRAIYPENLLDELEEIIDIDRTLEYELTAPIIFDGSQYTIKIPKKIAEVSNLNHGDRFHFKASYHINSGKPQSSLHGTLINDEANPSQK